LNHHLLSTILALYCLLQSAAGSAQQCRDTIPSSATKERFIASNDGTVTDRIGKLVWMRCSIGQSWNSHKKTCVGRATPLTWSQAGQAAEKWALKSKAPWRLPSIQELSSIVELRCANPAIDLQLFPSTPATHYWSGTPFVNQAGHFWLVQFSTGEDHTDKAKRKALVRLVKPL
jgi:hypothetical protein